MSNTTLGFGAFLVVLGVGAYFATGQTSVTALIPAFFGLPLALLGVAARRESWRPAAMHTAVVIGLLGALAALGRALPALASGAFKASTVVQLLMGVALAIYTVLCVRSFIAARRAAA